MKKTSIWYVGGKSAGHIMPLVTLSRQINAPAVFITTHRELDKKIIESANSAARGDTSTSLSTGGPPARRSLGEGWVKTVRFAPSMRPILTHYPLYVPDINRKKFWLFPWHIFVWLAACAKLTFLFFKNRPAKVISTGGLSAVPVFLFAQLFRIPCELFELNATPGDAVKFLAPLSSKIFYCYKTALNHIHHKQLYYKPYPVRKFDAITAHEARLHLKLDPVKKTICFLGGSQGSQFINHFAQQLISRFAPHDIQIIHQAGPADAVRLSEWYTENKYSACVMDYYAEIELLYSAADLVICRAGAGTLWELEYMNTPTCIIPLETSTTDHQLHNAQALCAQKPQQFFMIRQGDADKNIEFIMSQIINVR